MLSAGRWFRQVAPVGKMFNSRRVVEARRPIAPIRPPAEIRRPGFGRLRLAGWFRTGEDRGMGVGHAMVLLLLPGLIAPADGPSATDEVSKEFETVTLPTVKRYCLECHSAEEQEGDL